MRDVQGFRKGDVPDEGVKKQAELMWDSEEEYRGTNMLREFYLIVSINRLQSNGLFLLLSAFFNF